MTGVKTCALPIFVGKSLRQIAVARLRRDKVAMTCLAVLAVIAALAIFAPLICRFFGVNPYTFNSTTIGDNGGLPIGPLGGVSGAHPLGVEPLTGRDILARLLYGSRVSLLIAVTGTIITVFAGVILGIVAGNARGALDAVLNRVMDLTLAFPFLLVVIAMSPVLEQRLISMGFPQIGRAHV